MKESIVIGKTILFVEDVKNAKQIMLEGAFVRIDSTTVNCGSGVDAYVAFQKLMTIRDAIDLLAKPSSTNEDKKDMDVHEDRFVSIGNYVLHLSKIRKAPVITYDGAYVVLDGHVIRCTSSEEALEYFNHLKKLLKAEDVKLTTSLEEVKNQASSDFEGDVLNTPVLPDIDFQKVPSLKPHNTAGVVITSVGCEDDENNLPESATDETPVWRPKFGNVYFAPDEDPMNGIHQRVWGEDPEVDDICFGQGRVYPTLESAEKHKY